MLRAQHYREAERLAESAMQAGMHPSTTSLILLAQVHATLAACPIEGGYPNNYGAEE